MNDNPLPRPNETGLPATPPDTGAMRHEKIITPLHADITPDPAPPRPAAIPQPAVSPVPIPDPIENTPDARPGTRAFQQQIYPEYQTDGNPSSTSAPIDTTNTGSSSLRTDTAGIPVADGMYDVKSFWIKRILRLLASGVCGAVIGISYFVFMATSMSSLISLVISQNSPSIIFSSLIPMLVFGVIYAGIQRWILRSKHAVGQAAVAFPVAMMLVVALSVTNRSVDTLGLYVTAAGIIGAVVFIVVHYLSQMLWPWRISRTMIAFAVVLIAFAGTSVYGRAAYKAQTASEQAKIVLGNALQAERDKGNFDFNGGYQQYYLTTAALQRFEIIEYDAADMAKFPDASKDAAHFTQFTLADTTNNRRQIKLYQMKLPAYYKPPADCGMALPSSGLSHKPVQCGLVARTPDGGEIYRSLRSYETDHSYFMKKGQTLLTIFDDNMDLDESGAAALFGGLETITPEALSVKAKNQLTSAKPQSTTVDFPVFVPASPFGYSLSNAFITRDDPANPVIILHYDLGSRIGTDVATFYAYKKPSNFNPPQCGYERPPSGRLYTACELVATSKGGLKMYRDKINYGYWVDCGSTVVFFDVPAGKGLYEAREVLETIAETPAAALNLQPS